MCLKCGTPSRLRWMRPAYGTASDKALQRVAQAILGGYTAWA